MIAIKLLDATSGESSVFQSLDKLLEYKLVIEGIPNANIVVYYIEGQASVKSFEGYYLKLRCSDWGTANVQLYSKTDAPDDVFSSTGDIFTSDTLSFFKYS